MTTAAPAKLARLQRSAAASVAARGHRLGPWTRSQSYPCTAHARCDRPGCGAEVSVCTDPAPNGIDIAGPAVALDCRIRG